MRKMYERAWWYAGNLRWRFNGKIPCSISAEAVMCMRLLKLMSILKTGKYIYNLLNNRQVLRWILIIRYAGGLRYVSMDGGQIVPRWYRDR